MGKGGGTKLYAFVGNDPRGPVEPVGQFGTVGAVDVGLFQGLMRNRKNCGFPSTPSILK